MKTILSLLIIIITVNAVGQNIDSKKDIVFRYLAVEKNTKDTLIGAFTEVFSGNKRIKAKCCTDFNGVEILSLNQNDIVDNKIVMKIYGMKCKPIKKKFIVNEDVNTTIYLKYGKTDYNKVTDYDWMRKKLNIEYEIVKCGFVDSINVKPLKQ
jgi:hypothetical protein